jgi:hypothetical protein
MTKILWWKAMRFAVIACAFLWSGLSTASAQTAPTKIAFHVYSIAGDGSVKRLDWKAFRKIQENQKQGVPAGIVQRSVEWRPDV